MKHLRFLGRLWGLVFAGLLAGCAALDATTPASRPAIGMASTSHTGLVQPNLPHILTAEVLGVFFSPPTGAAAAIVKAIDASDHEVLVQAYGFTHQAIAQALVRAQQRGVSVRVLLDLKTGKTNRPVADVLAQGGVSIREDGRHAIAHNKVMVIDNTVVITGSFNFTQSAETRNAENVLILKSTPLALTYKTQWAQHWAHGRE